MNKIYEYLTGSISVLLMGAVVSFAGERDSGTTLRELARSVFQVKEPGSRGTGFAMEFQVDGKPVRYTVTANHVCAHKEFLWVPGFGKTLIKLKVLKRSAIDDVCLLTPIAFVKPLKPATYEPTNSQTLYNQGYPMNHEARMTPATGYVVGPVNYPEYNLFDVGRCILVGGIVDGSGCQTRLHLMDTTIPAMPGSSGSPVVNSDMGVVGLIVATWPGAPGLSGSYAPIKNVIKLVESR